MTQRNLRPCKQRGCNNLTRDKYGYCEEHLPAYLEKIDESKKKRMKKYDDKRKGEKYRAFYTTKKWANTRQYILIRDNYLCQDCYDNKKIVQAEHVHHMIELKDDWDKRYDEDNLISLCHECHNKRHDRF